MPRVECPNCSEELTDIVVFVPMNGRTTWEYCPNCKRLVDPDTGAIGPVISQSTLEQLQKV